MDFDLSKPQKLLKESARDFLARECKPERVRELMATETAYDQTLWQAIADQGWTGLILPEEYGGLGLGIVELAAVAEEMGRACLPGAFISTLFASALIARAGDSQQQARYLDAIGSGELKATVAILESSADWDIDAVKLEAGNDGSGFVLSGEKLFVPDADIADLIICVARHGRDLVLLPIDRTVNGLSITAMPSMDATRKLYRITFDNIRIAESDALSSSGDTRAALTRAIETATVALCAEMVGGMQWILDTTVEYAKTRQQFGRAIGSFQAVQHHCANVLLMVESSRSATYYAAWALTENDDSASRAISVAKAYCSDAFREVANAGVQVHGGIGFTWEHNLQLYYKRSKFAETMFGTPTFHRERIARSIVDGVNASESVAEGLSATASD